MSAPATSAPARPGERDGRDDPDGPDGSDGPREGRSSPADPAGGARAAILGRVAAALGRDAASTVAARPAEVTARIGAARRHTLPRVEPDLTAQLVRNMEAVLMSVVRLQRPEEVPEAVAFWLDAEGIAGDVSVAPALAVDGRPDIDRERDVAAGAFDGIAVEWPAGEVAGRRWRTGAASGEETVGVTPCMAAVAETGSVVLASGAGTPATLAFLPENHVVVLRASDVVAHVEDVFPRLRERDVLPRALNFVTGPSRTADIEQTIEIGAHGPRRMHVLIVEGS